MNGFLYRRIVFLTIASTFAFFLSSCVGDSIDEAINMLDKTRNAIVNESGNWRVEIW